MIGEETAAIFFGKNPGETPLITLEGTHFEDVYNDDVARLGTVHPDRAAQDVNNFQVDVSNILRVVVVPSSVHRSSLCIRCGRRRLD